MERMNMGGFNKKEYRGNRKLQVSPRGVTIVVLTCIILFLVTGLASSHVDWTVVSGRSKRSQIVARTENKPGDTSTIVLEQITTKPHRNDMSPVLETECFQVAGIISAGAYVFKGIPYAEPPVGALRWKPPKALELGSSEMCANRSDVFNATEFGEKCFQGENNHFEGSEDCLFLNVWTPSMNSSASMPVMVFLHGGGLEAMDGNTPKYYPNGYLAVSSNVVFVSLNYRLNVFGFLALDILSRESSTNTSGNYGLMDQVLALEWVKKNIASFGGDPNKVTLFGHSSGATAIYALLASPAADGLFHRAWLSSGSVSLNKTLAEASEANLQLLNNTGCRDTTCLYRLTPEELMKAIPTERWHGDDLTDLPVKGGFNDALAIVDGVFLPHAPLEAWQNNLTKISIPVLIGTTAQEVDMFAMPDGVKSWNWKTYELNVRERLDTFGGNVTEEALSLYPPGSEYDPEYQFTSMVSDVRVTCPAREQAEIMAAASSAHVYRYVVTSRPSKEVSYFKPTLASKPAYSYHTMDMFAFFGTLGSYINPLTKSDMEFQATMQLEVLHFARTGDVKTGMWRPVPAVVAVVESRTTITDAYHKEQCDFWDKAGFFPYAWIN